MNAKDIAVVAVLTVAFATFATAHVYLSVRLFFRSSPRWRGALAFFVPPLAPVWGFQAGLRVAPIVWIVAVVAYVLALLAA